MTQVAFRTKVVPVVVEVHLCLCASNVSVDLFWCHYVKKGSRPVDFRDTLPGVFRSQPSPWYAWNTPHPTSFLLRLRREFY